MNSFVYHVPVKVYFGENQLHNLGMELKKYGNRVLLVYGGGSIKRTGLYDKVVKEIREAGLELFELSGIEPNPRIESVRRGVQICKKEMIDVLLAVGGGSTIDAAKYIAAGALAEHDPWDFIAKNLPVEAALPILDILTLAATGSEMDACGVVGNPETQEKVAKIAEPFFPKVSFLDPTNTYTVSRFQTACGAADMLSHIMELYFSNEKGLYMLDCVMEGLMKTIVRYAPVAVNQPEDYEARANLMWTSSWAINGFLRGGNHQSWSCHPIEHELSAVYDITHGLGLAILTPRWMEYCLDESTAERFCQFAVNVFGAEPGETDLDTARAGIEKLKTFLFDTLGLQSTLTQLGIDDSRIKEMAYKACRGSVLPGYKMLDAEDIETILRKCL